MPLTFDIHKDPRFQEGHAEGQVDGLQSALIQGREKTLLTYIQLKLSTNTPISTIAKSLQMPIETVIKLIQKL